MTKAPKGLDAWPWARPAPRDPPPPTTGDIDAAIELGLATCPDGVAHLGATLTAALPAALVFSVNWARGARGVEFSIDHPDCKLHQTFARDEDGALVVDFGLIEINGVYQNGGHGLALVRGSAPVFDELGVTHVTCFANQSVGGYAWARMGAVPIDPSTVQQALRAKIDGYVRAAKSSRGFERLNEILNEPHDPRMMLRVALATGPNGEPIGKNLLLGFAWEAFWDLTDRDHRATIAKVLA